MMDISIGKTLECSFAEARPLVERELKAEGFGVQTEIDVKATIKEKLNKDFRNYLILGACNPTFAHAALEHNLDVGLMMPCNVIIYEDDAGKVVVKAMNLKTTIAAMMPNMAEMANSVDEKMRRVLAAL
jgi:uncharacterized protein (DUF302 family)